jgi:hypothetical protein
MLAYLEHVWLSRTKGDFQTSTYDFAKFRQASISSVRDDAIHHVFVELCDCENTIDPDKPSTLSIQAQQQDCW